MHEGLEQPAGDRGGDARAVIGHPHHDAGGGALDDLDARMYEAAFPAEAMRRAPALVAAPATGNGSDRGPPLPR